MQEVVAHLSQLKASLQDTLSEEERLKQQAYRVQRLAQVGITDKGLSMYSELSLCVGHPAIVF